MAYNSQRHIPYPGTEMRIGETFSNVMRHVYAWMCLGLFVTAAVAALLVHTPLFVVLEILYQTPILFYALLIGELGLVWWLISRMAHLSPTAAKGWFLVYAAFNGLTLTSIFLIYTAASIAFTFVATAGLFGVMAFIGYITKMDLSSWGSYLLMALIGLMIASLINVFVASTQLDWLLTYLGIILFIGLTIYDTQRIKKQVMAAMASGDSHLIQRVGIMGALSLYLDFINLFLKLLRLLGRRRRR